MEEIKNKYGTKLKFTREEQESQYTLNLQMLLTDTRYMLDNLEWFPVYECNWCDYHTGTGNKKKWKNNPDYKWDKHKGTGHTFNSTGWLYNGDSRAVYLSKKD